MASTLGNDLGSARFATLYDMQKTDLLHNIDETRNYADGSAPAFLLGRASNSDCAWATMRGNGTPEPYGKNVLARRSLLSWPWKELSGDRAGQPRGGHLITFASTRSGKGVGFILPNLLFYPGSVLVIDPKGENYAKTCEARRKMKQRICCLDPFGVCEDQQGVKVPEEEQGAFNPLDLLPTDTVAEDKWELALNIAEALVIKNPEAKDPHWDEKAQSLLAHFIFYVMEAHKGQPEKLHLGTVRHWVTTSMPEHDKRIKYIDDLYGADPDNWANQQMHKGVSALLNMAPDERSSVLSMMERHTSFLDSTRVVKVLSRSTFDMAELKEKGNVSVYLVLPADKLELYSRLLRLWIASAIKMMLRGKEVKKAKPVLFLLDEMAQIGPMPQLEKAVSLLAGYGMTM